MAELVYTLHGQTIENVMYFRYEGNPAESDLITLATNLAAWWADEVAPFLTSQIALTRVDVTELTDATSPVGSFVAPTPIPGGLGSQSLPANAALCLSFRTAGRGRSSRGRNYVAGISEDDHQESLIDLTVADGLRDAYATVNGYLQTNILENPPIHVVVSRYTGGSPRVTGLSQPVTNVIYVDRVVDGQRRRLPGRGN